MYLYHFLYITILVDIRIYRRNPTAITVLIIHEVVMSQRDTTQPWQCLNSCCDATRLVLYLLTNVYSKLKMSPIRDDAVTKLLSAWYNWIGVQKETRDPKNITAANYYARFTLSYDLLNISKALIQYDATQSEKLLSWPYNIFSLFGFI